MLKFLVIMLLLVTSFAGGATSIGLAALARIGVPSPSASYFPLIVAARKGFFAKASSLSSS